MRAPVCVLIQMHELCELSEHDSDLHCGHIKHELIVLMQNNQLVMQYVWDNLLLFIGKR